MNPEEIKKNIVSKSDDELIGILADRENYTPEAIEYATQELSKRKPEEEYFKDTYKTISAEVREKNSNAIAPLTLKEKIALLLFPIILPTLFVAPILLRFFPKSPGILSLREKGYYKKSSQAVIFFFLGIFLWFSLLLFYA